MYSIEKTEYGVKLIFKGFIKRDEIDKWYDESMEFLKTLQPGFDIIVDMRDLKPLPRESQDTMNQGQMMYMQSGMRRAAVILDNATTTMQFKRLGKEVGILDKVYYLNASQYDDWKKPAFKWLNEGEKSE